MATMNLIAGDSIKSEDLPGDLLRTLVKLCNIGDAYLAQDGWFYFIRPVAVYVSDDYVFNTKVSFKF